MVTPSSLTVNSPEPLSSTGNPADAGADECQTAETCGPCRAQPGGRARNSGSIRPCDRAGAVPRTLRHLWRPPSRQQRLCVGLRPPCARHVVPSPQLPSTCWRSMNLLAIRSGMQFDRRLGQIVGRCINCRARLPVLVRYCLRMSAKSDPSQGEAVSRPGATDGQARDQRPGRCHQGGQVCASVQVPLRPPAPVSSGFCNFQPASGRSSRAHCIDCCSKESCDTFSGAELQCLAYKQEAVCSRRLSFRRQSSLQND